MMTQTAYLGIGTAFSTLPYFNVFRLLSVLETLSPGFMLMAIGILVMFIAKKTD